MSFLVNFKLIHLIKIENWLISLSTASERLKNKGYSGFEEVII